MNRDEIITKLTVIFRDVFDDESLVITEETKATDIEDWDSLNHISLISAIESDFDIQFKMKDIVGMQKVGDAVNLIMKYTQ